MAGVSWAEALSAGSAFLSLITASIALAISRKATEAARQSGRAADAVAAIEAQRWHHEMTPRFTITATPVGPGTDQASLLLTFDGPPALERLDEVQISIRDDGYDHGADRPGGPSAQELAQQVWGPYPFRPGIDVATPDGRTIPGAGMELGGWRKHLLERTPVPHWSPSESWQQRYKNDPARLWVRCQREGHQPWLLTFDVPVTAPKA